MYYTISTIDIDFKLKKDLIQEKRNILIYSTDIQNLIFINKIGDGEYE